MINSVTARIKSASDSACPPDNPARAKKRAYGSVKDCTPIGVSADVPTAFVVHPSLTAKNVKEFIALAKAKPGQVTYASYGSGSSAHLTAELFKLMAGVDLLHVPYKGAAPAVNDLLGGQVNIIFADVAAMFSHLKSGKLKPLGIGAAKRFEGLGLPHRKVEEWKYTDVSALTREVYATVHGKAHQTPAGLPLPAYAEPVADPRHERRPSMDTRAFPRRSFNGCRRAGLQSSGGRMGGPDGSPTRSRS